MNISIMQGNKQLVKSDSVLVYNNDPTKIVIDGNFTVTLLFEDSLDIKNDTKQTISINGGKNNIEIKLNNFNNAIGTANANPIEIATQGDKKIFISFAVYSVGTVKLLHYNILSE